MQILYGISSKLTDVTSICYDRLKYNQYIYIPAGDLQRVHYFSDPLRGTLKSIFVKLDDGTIREYDHTLFITINTETNKIITCDNYTISAKNTQKVIDLQNTLAFKHGNFLEEFPEQRMVMCYLTGKEKVLEIGANIGRNTLIIASILAQQNNNNLVTLETDANTVVQLRENRDINNFSFQIENSALSKRKLIQSGWSTIVSDVLLDGYKEVNTITMDELNAKYQIPFDTLVLDCEGAFYYILMDMPEILTNIKLIIMENDYTDLNHKEYVNKILFQNNFKLDYVEAGGWDPCYSSFYETWVRA